MNRLFRCMAVIAALSGCSPADRRQTPLDEEFRLAIHGIQNGELPRGLQHDIRRKIISTSDESVRSRCLEGLRSVILSKEQGGTDYNVLPKRLARREFLFDDYLDVTALCGTPFPERMDFRIAFIEWLCAEHARQKSVGTVEDRVLGPHWTAEAYLDHLDRKIYRHLERLELAFDEFAARECSPEELARLRARLEVFFGRPPRSAQEVDRQSLEWARKWEEWRKRHRTGRPAVRPTWRDYFKGEAHSGLYLRDAPHLRTQKTGKRQWKSAAAALAGAPREGVRNFRKTFALIFAAKVVQSFA